MRGFEKIKYYAADNYTNFLEKEKKEKRYLGRFTISGYIY
jgi:hypothetical protein